jgi:GTPase SAR1 family protein
VLLQTFSSLFPIPNAALLLFQEAVTDVPVVLVGNKTDQWGDRMVSLEEGQRRSKEIGCVCFHEISVRESIEQVDTRSVRKYRTGRHAFY